MELYRQVHTKPNDRNALNSHNRHTRVTRPNDKTTGTGGKDGNDTRKTVRQRNRTPNGRGSVAVSGP